MKTTVLLLALTSSLATAWFKDSYKPEGIPPEAGGITFDVKNITITPDGFRLTYDLPSGESPRRPRTPPAPPSTTTSSTTPPTIFRASELAVAQSPSTASFIIWKRFSRQRREKVHILNA